MDASGFISAFIVMGAIVLLFCIPLAAALCLVAAWVYNLFH